MSNALHWFAPLSLAAAMAAPTAAHATGDQLFQRVCQSCHSAAPGAGVLGPNLRGVVGRKAGATAFPYSPALKAANIIWTRQNLDRFLGAPLRMVPGTRMVVSVPDPQQRTQLITYLAGQH